MERAVGPNLGVKIVLNRSKAKALLNSTSIILNEDEDWATLQFPAKKKSSKKLNERLKTSVVNLLKKSEIMILRIDLTLLICDIFTTIFSENAQFQNFVNELVLILPKETSKQILTHQLSLFSKVFRRNITMILDKSHESMILPLNLCYALEDLVGCMKLERGLKCLKIEYQYFNGVDASFNFYPNGLFMHQNTGKKFNPLSSAWFCRIFANLVDRISFNKEFEYELDIKLYKAININSIGSAIQFEIDLSEFAIHSMQVKRILLIKHKKIVLILQMNGYFKANDEDERVLLSHMLLNKDRFSIHGPKWSYSFNLAVVKKFAAVEYTSIRLRKIPISQISKPEQRKFYEFCFNVQCYKREF